MCGICGFYGDADAGRLASANDLMAHRGPDEKGLWTDPAMPAGLAMRRLSIVDLSTGTQPILSEDGAKAIVFNGEIYNAGELRQALQARGHVFRTRSDTESILHGYEEWGEDVMSRLRGMFSFAIADVARCAVFCARDRLGIKPFYYYWDGRRFAFASEVKPLLYFLRLAPACDLAGLAQLLVTGYAAAPATVFANIRQLEPGHSVLVSRDGLRLSRYWELPDTDPDACGSLAEVSADLRQALMESVHSHLMSDVPVGLTLSGGMDSSAVLACMARNRLAGQTDLHAFTIGYGRADDELPYARLAAENEPLELHERVIDPEEAVASLPAVLWHMEEPCTNIVAVTTYHLAKFVRSGLKVVLIGEGSDEIFAGYPHHRVAQGPLGVLPRCLTPRLYRMAFLQPYLGLAGRLLGGGEAARLVREAFQEHFLEKFRPGRNRLRSVLRFDLERELPGNQLLRVDKMMMAHSVEARVPFLDHQFLERAWRIPERLKVRDGVDKFVLREAFRGILPDGILSRPKAGTRGTQRIFPILQEAGLHAVAQRVLTDRRLLAASPLDPDAVRPLMAGRTGFPPLPGRVRTKVIYTLLACLVWHRLFMEQGDWTRHHDELPPLHALWD